LPLIHPVQEKAVVLAEEAIHSFPEMHQTHWIAGMRRKLGLFTEEIEDSKLIETLLTWMHKHQADYTNTFRGLASESLPEGTMFRDAEFVAWHARWQARLSSQPDPKDMAFRLMQGNNPGIIPRNHRVEEALSAAAEYGDYSLMQRLLAAVTNPYVDAPEYRDYHTPPSPSERVHQTFCGT
jgi:uncharacterized protein YdiU (UPF0061 family)